ncbi:MAG: AsmA family protein [Nitrospirae bacterium]|nr:AsmA family protein [Nitrospirota bacterium]
MKILPLFSLACNLSWVQVCIEQMAAAALFAEAILINFTIKDGCLSAFAKEQKKLYVYNEMAKMKKVLIILGGGAAALVLAILIFLLTFNINPYRPRIEAAASDAIGMKVRINGKIKLALFPRTGVSLEDILIQNRDADVASVKKAEVEMRLLPLLWRGIRIQQVKLINPAFFITKDRKGRFNVETLEKRPAGKKLLLGLIEAEKIFIRKGRLLYMDERSGGKTEADECDLAINNFSVGGGEVPVTLSLDGDLSCREVKAEGLRISDIRVVMKAREGKFEADPITMKVFGGDGKGSIKGVMTGESPEYVVDLAITKLRFEEVLEQFKQKKPIRGELDMQSHLTMKGKNANELTRTAQGVVSLRGQDLIHESLDLDRVLEKYETIQNFNLIDVGAFFVAGPLGTLLTKGYNFGSVYVVSLGGKSAIKKLVSEWKVKNGVAEAEDVALITSKNRVALKGRLDFVNEKFDNVTVAALDEKGCVRFSQKIYGPFRDPRVEKVSTLGSITGPILNLYVKTKKFLQGGKCEVFYAGSVAHPK